MPIDKPVLDTRTFDQLVGEGRSQIPRLAQQWTDHNLSDPGITLLDLLAWLTEMALYRLDRLPAETQRAFLRLLGIVPRPAGVASAIVVVTPQTAGPSVILPRGVQVADAAGGRTFQTTRPLMPSSAHLVSMHVGKAGALTDITPAVSQGAEFAAFGRDPSPGCALYLGFDASLGSAGDPVALFFATCVPEADAQTWAALIEEWRAARRDGCAADLRRHYSARTIWEFYRGAGQWATLPATRDSTRALSLSGFVRFNVPASHVAGPIHPERLFIRCRLLAGTLGCPPALQRVLLNAVPAVHAASAAEEEFAASRGRAQEAFGLGHTPVVAGSTRLRWTAGIDEDRSWQAVTTWDSSGPNDRHYLLEPPTGRVTFGDGRRGRVPTADWVPHLEYCVGGGSTGNVSAGTLTRFVNFVHPSLNVQQPLPAIGGRAADDLVDTWARVMGVLEEPQKAVTLADFEWFATHLPGRPIARAHALANHTPGMPCYPAPGCVTVVVVPDCTGPRPTPDAGLLQAVADYLGRRRLLTTEVRVIPPCYDRVTVHAVLHARAASDRAAIAQSAQAALHAFFDPLHGGTDGAGWPIGRGVYRTEILALLAQLPGVDRVTELGLQGETDAEPRCDNLPLCPDCLPESATHHIQVRGDVRPHVVDRSAPHECP